VPEDERAELLACLACVDVVTFFDEPTAEALIRRVTPDVWAKGRDYSEETLPEAHVVRELGGSIALVGDPKDHGASDFIDRIRGAGD
jgi:bifunctional ADP-heptose synthase (sugar kinase/adenylyltransferase)